MKAQGQASGEQDWFQHTNICSTHRAAGLGLHRVDGPARSTAKLAQRLLTGARLYHRPLHDLRICGGEDAAGWLGQRGAALPSPVLAQPLPCQSV